MWNLISAKTDDNSDKNAAFFLFFKEDIERLMVRNGSDEEI